MDRNLISFNLPNWITVLLMAAFGYLLLGIIAQLIIAQFGGDSGPVTQVANSAGGY